MLQLPLLSKPDEPRVTSNEVREVGVGYRGPRLQLGLSVQQRLCNIHALGVVQSMSDLMSEVASHDAVDLLCEVDTRCTKARFVSRVVC